MPSRETDDRRYTDMGIFSASQEDFRAKKAAREIVDTEVAGMKPSEPDFSNAEERRAFSAKMRAEHPDLYIQPGETEEEYFDRLAETTQDDLSWLLDDPELRPDIAEQAPNKAA